jgi:hypothetical protein
LRVVERGAYRLAASAMNNDGHSASDDAAAVRGAMRVRLHLKPGQRGTKQLLEQYGDQLICVRYRYDPERRKRFKTVELVVSERDWPPLAPAPAFAPDDRVAVPVAYGELDLRHRVKQAGGRWNPERKVWELRYDRAIALGLGRRIVPAQRPMHEESI